MLWVVHPGVEGALGALPRGEMQNDQVLVHDLREKLLWGQDKSAAVDRDLGCRHSWCRWRLNRQRHGIHRIGRQFRDTQRHSHSDLVGIPDII
jgi:hypothetical protein